MKAMGRKALAEEVEAVSHKAVLLAAGHGARWILLPDGRVILGRYSYNRGLSKWSQSDFTTHECTDYREDGGGCVGAVIFPDGVLQR